MKAAIVEIRLLLAGKLSEDLPRESATRAAFERFLEILSEASRHIPDVWKLDHPLIPWRQIADLGNHLRHAYHRTDVEAFWAIYQDELGPLEAAVDAMLRKHHPEGSG